MGAQILGIAGGILTVKVTGRLEHRELAEVQKSAAEVIRKHGPIRILILTENFKGWAKGGDWGDLSFRMENDQYIEKMAIVGDQPWEDLILMFTGRGFRGFPVQHFLSADTDKARAWLAESGKNPPRK